MGEAHTSILLYIYACVINVFLNVMQLDPVNISFLYDSDEPQIGSSYNNYCNASLTSAVNQDSSR